MRQRKDRQWACGVRRDGDGKGWKGPDMRVKIAGVELESPVIAASGTFGYGVEFEEIVALNKIGAFVTKGLSREPMAGNASPRIVETAAGMMNAIGLQNMGVRAFAEEKMPKLRAIPGAVVIANVFGFKIEDCLEVIRVLNDTPGIAMYELNASCPNTSHGGMVFGTDWNLLFDLTARCKAVATRPLMVKLSPNVTSIGPSGEGGAGWRSGRDVAGEYVPGAVDRCGDAQVEDCELYRRAFGAGDQADRAAAGVRGGAGGDDSGGGPGGILRAEDAVEFLLAGATAVQVGTASYADPRAVENIATGLRRWCATHDVARRVN